MSSRVALGGQLGHRLGDDRLERRWHVGDERAQRRRPLAHVLVGDRHRGLAGERRAPGEHLVEHHTEGVDVAARVDGQALGLLGREVGGGAHDEAGLCHLLVRADRTGDAEVGDLDLAVGGDEDVARLDVAVHDTVAMRIGERLGDPCSHGGRLQRRQRSLGADDRGERFPVDVFHDDEVGRLRLAPVEDRDDVGVAQVGGGLGLSAEALDEGVVGGELREEHLQRHEAVED